MNVDIRNMINALETMSSEQMWELTSSLSQDTLARLSAACSAAGAKVGVTIAQCPHCGNGLYIDIDIANKKLRLNCSNTSHGPWIIGDIQ
jgi:hypothetical protein